jgi:hypothetical protein
LGVEEVEDPRRCTHLILDPEKLKTTAKMYAVLALGEAPIQTRKNTRRFRIFFSVLQAKDLTGRFALVTRRPTDRDQVMAREEP